MGKSPTETLYGRRHPLGQIAKIRTLPTTGTQSDLRRWSARLGVDRCDQRDLDILTSEFYDKTNTISLWTGVSLSLVCF